MTENEAIKQFEERLSIKDYREKIPEYYEAMEIAISALEEVQQYRELGTVEELNMNFYKEGNADNIDKAVYGLDIFTKNWCMNCEETEKKNNLTFRCKECNFSVEDGICLIKYFANNHKHNYPMKNFGSMG